MLTVFRLAAFFGGLTCMAGGFIYGKVPVILLGGAAVAVSIVAGWGSR